MSKSAGLRARGPADGHALLLPAGQLGRLAPQSLAEAEQRSEVFYGSSNLSSGCLAHLQGEGDVVVGSQVGVERVVLEDHGDVSLA